LAQHYYEGMFILDPNRYSRDMAGVSGQVNDLLAGIGANVLVSRLWDERRLAYPIKNHRRGAYWLTYFEAESTKIDDLNRQCLINDNILRHLFVRLDERVVEPLVAHAQGTVPEGGEGEGDETKSGEPKEAVAAGSEDGSQEKPSK